VRNDAMMAEMQGMRNQHATQQRELRILSGTFEKCNNERQRMTNELARTKEYSEKLELQLARLGDLSSLTKQLDEVHSNNHNLLIENKDIKNMLDTRDIKIKKLERELEAFHRSVELQTEYEIRQNDNNNSGLGTPAATNVGGSNSEVSLRSLYYELGKRQTDAHSLALALATANNELKNMQLQVKQTKIDATIAIKDRDNLHDHCRELTKQAVLNQDEVAQLMSKLSEMKLLLTNVTEESASLATKLHESENSNHSIKLSLTTKINSLNKVLDERNNENNRFKVRIEGLNNTIIHLESMKKNLEKKLTDDKMKYDEERGIFAIKLKSALDNNKDINVYKTQVKELSLLREKHDIERKNWLLNQNDYKIKINDLSSLLENMKKRENELLSDRESSVKALQQTIEATKELLSRYNDEKVKRITAQEKLAACEERSSAANKIAFSVTRAKDHVSNAVLDALSKEKTRSAELQKQLHDNEPITDMVATAASSGAGNSNHDDDDPFKGQDMFSNTSDMPPQPPANDSSQTSHNNQGYSSDAKAELARLRAELNQMEATKP
jgi:hypothetical protein